MVSGLISAGAPIGAFIGIGGNCEREWPGSSIAMHIIKERVRRGDTIAFVSYESEIDFSKYEDILCPKNAQ